MFTSEVCKISCLSRIFEYLSAIPLRIIILNSCQLVILAALQLFQLVIALEIPLIAMPQLQLCLVPV